MPALTQHTSVATHTYWLVTQTRSILESGLTIISRHQTISAQIVCVLGHTSEMFRYYINTFLKLYQYQFLIWGHNLIKSVMILTLSGLIDRNFFRMCCSDLDYFWYASATIFLQNHPEAGIWPLTWPSNPLWCFLLTLQSMSLWSEKGGHSKAFNHTFSECLALLPLQLIHTIQLTLINAHASDVTYCQQWLKQATAASGRIKEMSNPTTKVSYYTVVDRMLQSKSLWNSWVL